MSEEVILPYTDNEGMERNLSIDNDSTEVRIRELAIQKIDLSPLKSLKHLEELYIFRISSLEKIDLSPLQHCYYLRKLVISSNKQLRRIHYRGISKCPNLNEIYISFNPQLSSVDLEVISNCPKLKKLEIYLNDELTELDLIPLSNITALNHLRIMGNHMVETLDLTPLLFCRKLHLLDVSGAERTRKQIKRDGIRKGRIFEKIKNKNLEVISFLSYRGVRRVNPILSDYIGVYDYPIFYHNLEFIRKLTPMTIYYDEKKWKISHLARCICVACGLDYIGLVDISKERLREFSRLDNIEDLRSEIIIEYCKQVNSGGSTIGANLDKLSLSDEKLLLQTPRILELRKKELNDVQVTIDSEADIVDLKGLWLTVHF